MKYANYIIFILLLCIGLFFKDSIHISSNLLSLFASKDTIEKFKIADNLGVSKELLIVVQGFDETSRKKVQEITKKLKTIEDILYVQSTIIPSSEIQQYYKKYYLLLSHFDDKKQTKKIIDDKLQRLYDTQINNVFYTAINKNDPLKLFNFQHIDKSTYSHHGKYISLGDYGYLIRVKTDVSPSQMYKAKILYEKIDKLLNHYDGVTSFAPFYYTVENSMKIQKDVQWIVFLSTVILLIVYYLLLKNIKLLLHTLIALASSMLFAIFLSTLVFSNFNILSLAFGMSITAVSIDYLLHYYFHNFYKNNQKIDKNVLYGYLTTVIAFGIFSFIPIPLISQISFFTVVSLSFAFFLFTFIFPQLNIKEFHDISKQTSQKKIIPASLVFIVSILLLVYSAINIKFDTNIRNLDYQNVKLQNIQNLIGQFNSAKLVPIIVKADSKQKLINNLYVVQNNSTNTFSLASFVMSEQECLKKKKKLKTYDFDKLNVTINNEAKKIGFRNKYFEKSYNILDVFIPCKIDNFDIFKSYGLSIYKQDNIYYTIAFVDNIKKLEDLDFIINIDTKEIFSKQAKQMYKNLLLFASLVIIFIFISLLFSVKKRFIYALNYVLFPISLTLALLVSFVTINIMHLFSLIILIAIGIDFGIYMSNSKKLSTTILAIKYSIFSTFGAFGVLIFSSITALNSIGVVISMGIASIFLLVKVMK